MFGSKPAWKVEVHDGVVPVEAEWKALAGPTNATPFQSFEMMRLFYRQLAANGQAEPVVALVRHPEGRPAALFALMRSRRHGLNWLHSDARPLDYCAPILDPELTRAEVRAVIAAMLAAVPKADLVYFNKMPADFAGTPNPLVGLANAGRLRVSAWYLRLSGRGSDDLRALQHHSFRNNLKRRQRNLAKLPDRALRFAIGADITDDDFAVFRALRAESAAEKDRHNILEAEDWAGFYAGLRAGEAGTCQPWLGRLDVGGETVAVLFGFTDGRQTLAILPASKLGAWKSLAPGLLLFEEAILFFRQRGTEIFDMSVGDMAYKIRFGCEELALYDALFPKTLRGRAYYLAWRLKVKIRDRMKRIAEE